jgi:hypothetical protein
VVVGCLVVLRVGACLLCFDVLISWMRPFRLRSDHNSNLAVLSGAVTVFAIRASLQVSVPTEPCLFRRTLHRRIDEARLTVFGTCDRSDAGVISIDFKVLDLEKRAMLTNVIIRCAQECASTISTVVEDLETSLKPVVEESVAKATLQMAWRYDARPPSPESHVYVLPTALAETDIITIEKPKKRPRSDGEGSTGTQEAHVLFAGKQHRGLMVELLRGLGVEDPNKELEPLLQLTFPFGYRSHQDYDNFYFFFAYKFTERTTGVWSLHTQPRILRVELVQEPDLLEVPSMSNEVKVVWRRALALRKALSVALHNERVHKPSFEHDWNEDESSCWSV